MYRIGSAEVEEIAKVIAGKKLFRMGDPSEGHQAEVERFEKEWASTIGADYALLMSGGGTSAIICALAALGVGPGDEVLVPGYTWMATAAAALTVGAIPVLVEVDETLGMDPDDVAARITPNVKAIVPVHMVGRPCNMDRLLEVTRPHGIHVVEDCCQCDGGSYHGRRVGTYGAIGAFSFNDFKIISCGEGGAIVTNDRTLFDRARVYHDSLMAFPTFAKDLTVEPFIGLQLRSTEIMGAILRMQLERLEGILSDLRRVAGRFRTELSAAGLTVTPSNDQDGDCGVVASFSFATSEQAYKFASAPGVGGWLPIDSNRHVYCNWDPVLLHHAGHHPDMNPYNFPQNQRLRTQYSADMLPKTLDHLARAVFISMNPDWTEAEIATRIEACRAAARDL